MTHTQCSRKKPPGNRDARVSKKRSLASRRPLLSRRISLRLSPANHALVRRLARDFRLPTARFLRRLILGQPMRANPIINILADRDLARVTANLTQLARAHGRRPFPSLVDATLFQGLPPLVARLRDRLREPSVYHLPAGPVLDPTHGRKTAIIVVRFREGDVVPRPVLATPLPLPHCTYRAISAATKGRLFRLGIELNSFAHTSNAGRLYDLPVGFLEELRAAFTAALGEL